MSENFARKLMSMCVVWLFVLSAIGAMGNTMHGAALDEDNGMAGYVGESVLEKMDAATQDLVRNGVKGMTKVIVATTDVAEVADYLRNYEFRGLVGNKATAGANALTTLTLEVPVNSLDGLSALPSVYGVYEYPETGYGVTRLMETGISTEDGDGPLSIYDSEQHKAQDAWIAGYIGTGSNIAIPEGGIDFGHPDLQGTQARIPADSSSPYAGWPIVFDYDSMSTYLSTGDPTDTWYVSTNETATKYTTPHDPRLDIEISITKELTFYNATVQSRASTTLKHGTVKPGSVTVYRDSIEMLAGYTVNHDMGVITFTPSISVKKIEVSYIYYSWDNVPESQRIILSQATGYTPSPAGSPEGYTVSGLEPDTNYLFNIRATDEANNHGDFSNNPDVVTFGDTTPPGKITDLAATVGPVHGTVVLEWTAPGDDGATGTASEYLVKYSKTPIPNWVCFDYLSEEYAQSWVPKVAGSPESHTLTGLEVGGVYHFAIIAYDEAGNPGLLSNSDSATVKNDVVPPARIDPTASPGYNSTEIILEWIAAGDDETVGTATSYEIRYSTSNITTPAEFAAADIYTDSLAWVPQPSGSAERYSLVMPSANVLYYFSIVAIDIAGNTGPISSPAGSAVSQFMDIIPPAQITDLVVETGINHGTVFLNFTAPGDDGMDGWASSYIVKFYTSPIDDTNWDTIPEDYGISGTHPDFPTLGWYMPKPLEGGTPQSIVLGTTDGVSFSFLPAGATYYFAIRAFDGANHGDVSNTDSATIQNDVVGPAVATLNIGESEEHGHVLLDWICPGDDGWVGTPRSFDIRYHTSPITDANWGGLGTNSFAINYAQFEDTFGFIPTGGDHLFLNFSAGGQLQQGVLYYFGIKARDEMNMNTPLVSNSPSGMVRNDIIPPDAIALSVAAMPQQGTVQLTWSAPGDDGDTGVVRRYEIRYVKAHYQNEFLDADVQYVGVLNPTMVWTTYRITGIHSASGVYRLGTLPDENLATYVNNYDNTVANYSKLLLVDSVTPYVYDTVYIDLNYDQDFTDEKPCFMGDEISWRDMDGDGLADLSGGMVYYISRASVVDTPETLSVNLTAGKADLAHPNIINNTLTIYWSGQRSKIFVPFSDNVSVIPHAGVIDSSLKVYRNDVLMSNIEYTVDFEAGEITFLVALNATADRITLDYSFDAVLESKDITADLATGTVTFGMEVLAADVVKATYEYDGLPIPYSERLAERTGVDNVVPRNGELVAMYGEYALDMTSGTSRASAIVGRAKTPHTLDTSLKPVLGVAPDAKIIGITTPMYDGMIFAIEGYDGIPGTGDEANIYSSSLAMSRYEAGGDFASYYIDWLATEYGGGKTLFAASSGEDGPGYGTVASPGSAPGVITAGLATDFYYRIAEGQDTGPNPSYGDIIPVSGRGPTAMGNPKPDVVVTGAYFNFIAEALWTAYDSSSPNDAYTQVVNTGQGGGLASSNLAAALAIVSQAYTEKHSQPLDIETARKILMSGAENINYDVLAQGAGFVDIMESANIAAGTGGSTVSPTSWVPGDYRGNRYEAFTKLVGANTLPENLQQTFTVTNTGTSSMDVDLFAGEMLKAGEGMITITRDEEFGHAWTILNGTGFYAPDGELLQGFDPTLWTGTDLIKITQYSTSTAQNYWLELYDWTDENGNGKLDGPLDGGPYESTPVPFAERNRMTAAFFYGNVLECRVHDQHDPDRVHDGIAIWTRALENPAEPLDIHIKVEFFSRMAWDWITLSKATMTVPVGGTGTFTATLNPAKAMAEGVGSYEGAVIVESNTGKETVVPIVVNVAADNPKFEFGDGTPRDSADNFVGVDSFVSVSNETSVANAVENQTSFFLLNKNIMNQTFIVIDGVDNVVSPYTWQYSIEEPQTNDTIVSFYPGDWTDNDGTFYTSHTNIVPGTEKFLYYDTYYEEWNWLSPSENNTLYTFDHLTGEFVLDWSFDNGDQLYAWYDFYIGYYPVNDMSWYDVDIYTGNVTLDTDIFITGLNAGTKVYTWYEYQSQKKSFQLSHTNIVSDSFVLTENGFELSSFNTVSREILMNNTREYVNQLVIEAVDNTTTTAFLELYEEGYEVGPGTYKLYLDGVEMIERYGETDIDYSLDLQTGEIKFGAPLKRGMEVRATYGTYAVGVTELTISNGNIYDKVKSGSDVLGYLLYRNGNAMTDGIGYYMNKIPVKNETSIIAAGGEADFSLANKGITLASENTLYLKEAGSWTSMVESTAPGKPNYSINYNSGLVTLSGWTLAAGDKVHSYYNYSGCVEGKIKLNTFNRVSGEVAVESAAAGQSAFSVFYGNLNDIGASAPNRFYYTNASGTFTLVRSGTPGPLNYNLDFVTGMVTLNGWAMTAGAQVVAHYNYTGLKSGDIFELDYSYGRFFFNPINGQLDFLTPPEDGALLEATYGYYDSQRLYDPTIMFSGFSGSGGRAGDWRFFYVDIPSQGLFKNPNLKLLVNVEWWKEMTDIDSFGFGNTNHFNTETGASFPVERYGPYGLKNNGGSTETADVFTASGGPMDYATPSIGTGLNVIAIHAIHMNGTSNLEPFKGEVGTFTLDKDMIDIVTNSLSGEATVTGYSNLALGGPMGGVAAGPSAPTQYRDMEVWQDEADWSLFDSFEDQLASGNTTVLVDLKDCLIFHVRIYGHTADYTREGSFGDVVDLDLGIFYDADGDGIPKVDNFVALDADGDADEQVRLISPEDGTYIIVIYGFTLKTLPAHFDIDITIVQGLGFGVDGEGEDLTPDNPDQWKTSQPIPPYQPSTLWVSYDLPSARDGITLQGALYLGPGNAPFTMLLPIELRYDSIAPSITGNNPPDGSITRNRRPSIAISFDDPMGELVSDKVRIKLDGMDVTSVSSVNIPLVDDEEAPVKGYPTGTISYVPPGDLSEGIHNVEASMGDLAGNVLTKSWTFVIDSSAPALSLDPMFYNRIHTNDNAFTLTGQVEKGATLTVMGATLNGLQRNADGTFIATLELELGENVIQASATDAAGNRASDYCTVIYDTTVPVFTTVRFSSGFTTNQPHTTMSGKLTESGSLEVNGGPVTVNSDGSFEKTLALSEGVNTFHLVFTDLAGNVAHSWQNVTLDTVAPVIGLTAAQTKVTEQSFVLTGTVEANSELLVNGKRISLGGTRQSTSDFTTTITLSPGLNTIVIEARDSAGNVAELRHVVEYDTDTGGANYGAIGVMIALLVVGLILGMFLGPMILPAKKDEAPEEDMPIDEELPGEDELPTDEGDMVDFEAEPVDGEEALEPIPAEESIPEEMGESMEAETAVEADVPVEAVIPVEADAPVEADQMPVEESEEMPAEPEDPRITKLREAYESGKISKELYEKNLARFKGQ